MGRMKELAMEMQQEAKQNQAKRYNSNKLSWSLVDFNSLEPLVKALENGERKYGRDNWKNGLSYNEVLESLLRHIFSMLNGEMIDDESGVHHIGHVMANAMFISYMEQNTELKNRFDNLSKK